MCLVLGLLGLNLKDSCASIKRRITLTRIIQYYCAGVGVAGGRRSPTAAIWRGRDDRGGVSPSELHSTCAACHTTLFDTATTHTEHLWILPRVAQHA